MFLKLNDPIDSSYLLTKGFGLGLIQLKFDSKDDLILLSEDTSTTSRERFVIHSTPKDDKVKAFLLDSRSSVDLKIIEETQFFEFCGNTRVFEIYDCEDKKTFLSLDDYTLNLATIYIGHIRFEKDHAYLDSIYAL